MSVEEIYLAMFRTLVHLAYRRGVPYDEAQALVHDVFAAFHKVHDLIEKPENYLKAAVVNRCASYWRREKRRSHEPLPERPYVPDYDRRIDAVAIWTKLSRRDRRVLRSASAAS